MTTTTRLSNAQTVALVRFAKGCFPAMQVDEFTPDAWSVVLGPYLFEDCKEALVNLARRVPFAAASDICTEVRRIRRGRLDRFGLLPEPPSGLEFAEYQAWSAATTRRIADGDLTVRPAVEVVPHGADYAELMPRVPDDGAS